MRSNNHNVLVLKGELVDLNTYINAERGNRFAAAKIKKEATEYVRLECLAQHIVKFTRSVYLTFYWYCKDKRKDKDNIEFAKKFIFDGMVQAGVLKNDGWDNIENYHHEWFIDKDNPRVAVEIN